MKERVIVADDEYFVREMMAQLFSEAGYEVFTALSADELLQLARLERVVGVVTDNNLGKGGSGLEALREIHRDPNLAHVRLVLVSATRLNAEAKEIGAAFLEKPFTPNELLRALGVHKKH